jgi:AcrR family transcriptional regulator
LFYNRNVCMPHLRPKQSRSRATLDRLTASTRKLLLTRRFDDISIREVVEEADASIGAFYNRFTDKRALLEFLDVQQTAAALTLWTAFFERPRWRSAPAREIIAAFVAAAVRAHRQNAGLLRAVFFHVRAADDPDFRARARRIDQLIRRRLTELLLARRVELRHPEPDRAVPFALLVTAASIREAILFEDLRLNPAELADTRLAVELTRAFCSYVGAEMAEDAEKSGPAEAQRRGDAQMSS